MKLATFHHWKLFSALKYTTHALFLSHTHCTNTHTNIHMYTHVHSYTHTHVHIYTHTYTHTHTHTHTHTPHMNTQLLDVTKERILLDTTKPRLDANGLSSCVPDFSPRYHFFRFKHTHEGDYQEAIGMMSATGYHPHIASRRPSVENVGENAKSLTSL